MRNPSTRYDKYIEEHRSFNQKKRGNAWFELSGGKDMRSECGEEYYKKVVEYSNKNPNSKDNIQIEKDITRYAKFIVSLFIARALRVVQN